MASQGIREGPANDPAGSPSRRRFLGVGFGSGALAGICCMGTAVAVGAGLSGLAFFRTWMNRYQVYFILLGVTFMAVWFIRQARRQPGAAGVRAGLRGLARHALVMAAAFVVMLGATTAVAGVVSTM